MPESTFLRRWHAGFGVPREQVTALVTRVLGVPVSTLSRVVGGYDNEVYRVETARGAFFVRIRRAGEGGFGWETWAMDRAREAGVPVPEVVALDEIDGGREVMVACEVVGSPLDDLAAERWPSDRREVLTSLGRVLARLHAVATPGQWRPDASGVWPRAESLAAGFVRDRLAEREQLVEAGLSAHEIETTMATVVEFTGTTEPVLCHGDLKPEHVFVEGDHVTALVDWGMSHGGSAIGEFAYAWDTFGTDGLEKVLEGYGSGSMHDPDFRRSLAAAAVQSQVGHIAHHVALVDDDGVTANVAFLRRALATLG